MGLTAVAVNGETWSDDLLQVRHGIFSCGPSLIEIEVQDLKDSTYQVIATSPEMLNLHSKFRDLVQSPPYAGSIGGLIIDEAHVISQWGTTFRKEYGNILNVRALVPLGVPVYATTATAQPTVLHEIRAKLGINPDTCFYLNLGNDRPNLAQEIKFIRSSDDFDALGFLATNVKTVDDLPHGMVFVNSIAHSQLACREFRNQLPEELRKYVVYLHSKHSPGARGKVLEQFRKGEIKILFATECGGMVSLLSEVCICVIKILELF